MYILKAEHSFDSAHFLANYEGKCSNIHGHRWKVLIEVQSEELVSGGQLDGMVIDFGDLKRDVKAMADFYDHALIIQRGTMRKETLELLVEDGFKIIEVEFRPTAENFAAFFFKCMEEKGYNVKRATVYETPTNCASYERNEVR
ncbi:6-carboxytetrahydropterin synthase QueD [Tepidibacter thalassicus]|uniref:6-carboxy-5,6,7,8-tetrahydropterin synthase n=1 Tax=Tepidibacter thalassicus DSM 15285 TaxID=1123350 RepID=A0A1M5QN30_9FIRM|nr:6-carboxytetrahydropterin synthase QueD [Tepidibacter thalassicus]SHH15209.1 preQ(0) biosynthesis protein QueD [Tepidibacter thalassicus DSM 15285]